MAPNYYWPPAQVFPIQEQSAAHTMPPPTIGPPTATPVRTEASGDFSTRSITIPAAAPQQVSGRIENRKTILIINTGGNPIFIDKSAGVGPNNLVLASFAFIVIETKAEIWAFSPLGTTISIAEDYYLTG
jgi:hypothetical protein